MILDYMYLLPSTLSRGSQLNSDKPRSQLYLRFEPGLTLCPWMPWLLFRVNIFNDLTTVRRQCAVISSMGNPFGREIEMKGR